MFACIYFLEDASLSVVGKDTKTLVLLGDFKKREYVKMKWGKKEYNGVIVKVGENEEELSAFATKADSKILKKKGPRKSDGIPEELFVFDATTEKKEGKRPRKETKRLKESNEQENDSSPKKKKQVNKNSNSHTDTDIPLIPKTSVHTDREVLVMSDILKQFKEKKSAPSPMTEQLTPTSFTQQMPATIQQQTPTSFTQLTPATVQQQTPTSFTQQTPATIQQHPPTTFTQQTPATFQPQTPTSFTQLTPATIQQQTPTSFTQQTPTTIQQQTPTSFTQQTPTTIQQQTPTSFTQQTPTTIQQQTPTSFTQQTPATIQQQTPTSFTQQTPATIQQQTPTSFTQQMPTTIQQQTPTSFTQQTPTTIQQQTPTSFTQQTPTTIQQQTPTSFTQQTPATIQQQTPTSFTQQTTATFQPQTPTSFTQQTPATIQQQTPTSFTQQTPATIQPQTPTSFTQLTPATIQQQTPISFTHQTPATIQPQTPTSFTHQTPAPMIVQQMPSPISCFELLNNDDSSCTTTRHSSCTATIDVIRKALQTVENPDWVPYEPTSSTPSSSRRQLQFTAAPSEAVLDFLTLITNPEVQEFAANLVNTFRKHPNTKQDAIPVTTRRSEQANYTCLQESDSEDCTPSNSRLQQESCSVPELRRSPRKLPAAKRNESQCVESGKNGDSQLLLKDYPSVYISPAELNRAIQVARKASKPGYRLCYRLLKVVFSTKDLAQSRGQGLSKPKEGDLRPVLDRERVEAVKDYAIRWCKKNSKDIPTPADLNLAITEQISHCRKLMKTK